MKIVYVEGNGGGNCLFQSCAYHVGVDYNKLRKQVANVIRNYPALPINGSILAEWLNWIGYNHFQYSEYIALDGVFGTAFELMIISIIYRRTIRVMRRKNYYNFDLRLETPEFQQIDEYFPEFGNPFYLLFSGSPNNGHYDPLE